MRILSLLFLLILGSLGCQHQASAGVASDGVTGPREGHQLKTYDSFKQYPRWKYNPKRRIRPRIKTV